jgi:hypothetical protein
MTVRVAISDPCLLARLTDSLEGHACTVRALSDRAFEITSVGGRTVDETRLDLQFFLRAWQGANPGVHLLVD